MEAPPPNPKAPSNCVGGKAIALLVNPALVEFLDWIWWVGFDHELCISRWVGSGQNQFYLSYLTQLYCYLLIDSRPGHVCYKRDTRFNAIIH